MTFQPQHDPGFARARKAVDAFTQEMSLEAAFMDASGHKKAAKAIVAVINATRACADIRLKDRMVDPREAD
ncbi:hypothetical protein [Roseibium sediminicola]|uniref:Uncharacterized protein n=1 Tax=Roseibium sediminicola TaxID=2933272 RepID=A0ABT0H1P3_9HYPH|nr:hypothetical protein [Roseibium sp. CAU 1639]MCK7615222.1 hypothetical protein [Roseibium sp. CAU 1639]